MIVLIFLIVQVIWATNEKQNIETYKIKSSVRFKYKTYIVRLGKEDVKIEYYFVEDNTMTISFLASNMSI